MTTGPFGVIVPVQLQVAGPISGRPSPRTQQFLRRMRAESSRSRKAGAKRPLMPLSSCETMVIEEKTPSMTAQSMAASIRDLALAIWDENTRQIRPIL